MCGKTLDLDSNCFSDSGGFLVFSSSFVSVLYHFATTFSGFLVSFFFPSQRRFRSFVFSEDRFLDPPRLALTFAVLCGLGAVGAESHGSRVGDGGGVV